MNFSQYTFGVNYSREDDDYIPIIICKKCTEALGLDELDGNEAIGIMIKHSASKKCKKIAKEALKGIPSVDL